MYYLAVAKKLARLASRVGKRRTGIAHFVAATSSSLMKIFQNWLKLYNVSYDLVFLYSFLRILNKRIPKNNMICLLYFVRIISLCATLVMNLLEEFVQLGPVFA